MTKRLVDDGVDMVPYSNPIGREVSLPTEVKKLIYSYVDHKDVATICNVILTEKEGFSFVVNQCQKFISSISNAILLPIKPYQIGDIVRSIRGGHDTRENNYLLLKLVDIVTKRPSFFAFDHVDNSKEPLNLENLVSDYGIIDKSNFTITSLPYIPKLHITSYEFIKEIDLGEMRWVEQYVTGKKSSMSQYIYYLVNKERGDVRDLDSYENNTTLVYSLLNGKHVMACENCNLLSETVNIEGLRGMSLLEHYVHHNMRFQESFRHMLGHEIPDDNSFFSLVAKSILKK